MRIIKKFEEVFEESYEFLSDAVFKILSDSYFQYSIIALSVVLIYILIRSALDSGKLYYLVIGWQIFNDNKIIENIQIFYKDKEVENLAFSHIAFFNPNAKLLRFSEIEVADFLKLKIDDGFEIFETKVQFAKGKKAYFKVSNDENRIFMKFRELEKNDGLVFRVFHTTNNDKFGQQLETPGLLNHDKDKYLDLFTEEVSSKCIKLYHNMERLKKVENIQALSTTLGIVLSIHIVLYWIYDIEYFLQIPNWTFLWTFISVYIVFAVLYLRKSVNRTDYEYYKRLNIENNFLAIK